LFCNTSFDWKINKKLQLLKLHLMLVEVPSFDKYSYFLTISFFPAHLYHVLCYILKKSFFSIDEFEYSSCCMYIRTLKLLSFQLKVDVFYSFHENK
jgi:hypothetical protein